MFTKIQIKNAIICSLLALFALGCSEKQREITDMQNRTVKLPVSIDRVVCLSPGITELMYEFGIEDKLVGRSSFCRLPQQVMSLPEMGGMYKLDTAAIRQINPDLVLASSILPWDARRFLARNNIPVVIFKDNTVFEDIFPAIELMGKVFNLQSKAEEIKNTTQQRLSALNRSNKPSGKTVYFAIRFDNKANLTVNGKHLTGDLLTKAGLKNIAQQDNDMVFSLEELISADPEYIFVMKSNYDKFINTYPYNQLNAVVNKKVFAVDENLLNPLSLSNLKAVEEFEKLTD
ncbi:MAG: ABC transporter substrate-binding protein [Bacteroidales bacterium]|nr:ABC transporter substrate-binding protein [Bacteroidales bacterium]